LGRFVSFHVIKVAKCSKLRHVFRVPKAQDEWPCKVLWTIIEDLPKINVNHVKGGQCPK